MNETNPVKAGQSTEAQKSGAGEPILRPPVTIFEDAEGITLQADMPGVTRDGLQLQVDKDQLLVEGDARLEMQDGMEALYADVRSTHYRRGFALSGELDIEHIDANLKDGVLTLRIPKRAEVRARKIEVRTA
ncbi:MAG: Hsp20/alpha crystallin family protein [Chromatiaceae bacterium]